MKSFAYNKEDEIPCELCGNKTPYLGTKKCNTCWEMEKGLKIFINTDKKKAKKWLENQLKKLGD